MPKSYRRGIELSVAVRPQVVLSFGGNATFSQNRIEDYTNRVIDYSTWNDATNFYDYAPHADGHHAHLLLARRDRPRRSSTSTSRASRPCCTRSTSATSTSPTTKTRT